MKNIHLTQWHGINQYIYITSNDKALEPEWGYIPFEGGTVKRIGRYFADDWKKIILTTDPKLIKDGVQAIDENFLKWFIKNSSCEYVDTRKVANGVGNNKLTYEYKIIIPKDEPKPIHQQIIDAVGGEDKFREIAKIKPKKQSLEEIAEILKGKELFKESNDRARKVLSEIKSLPIQETLEEVADNSLYSTEYLNESQRIVFKKGCVYGAKWQQEQDKDKYSEEEVKQLLCQFDMSKGRDLPTKEFDEWFEQFKKK